MPPGSKSTVLKRLVSDGLQFDYILDVGIMRQTQALRELFPDKMQYLFEPLSEWHDEIKRRYSQNKFELVPCAVGREAGTFRLFKTSILSTQTVTHSRLPGPNERPRQGEVEQQIEVCTLNDFVTSRNLTGAALLKIDVDGNELDVIAGAGEILRSCACVIMEAGKSVLLERLQALLQHGFYLYDLCDFCYYDNTFSQVDLVALNKTLAPPERFNPLLKSAFDPAKWVEL